MNPIKYTNIKIDILPGKNMLFDYIIYVIKDNRHVIVENCETGAIASSTVNMLNRYIPFLKPVKICKKTVDVDQLSFLELDLEISDEDIDESEDLDRFILEKHLYTIINVIPMYYNIRIVFNFSITRTKIYQIIKHKDIPQTENFRIIKSNNRYTIQARLPILPTVLKQSPLFSLTCVAWIYNDELYYFPYGNVSVNNVCLGPVRNIIDTPQNLFNTFINRTFNTDFGFKFRYSQDEKPIFDLKKILERINKNKQVSLIDIFYLLAHEDIEKIPFDKILLKVAESTIGEHVRDKILYKYTRALEVLS